MLLLVLVTQQLQRGPWLPGHPCLFLCSQPWRWQLDTHFLDWKIEAWSFLISNLWVLRSVTALRCPLYLEYLRRDGVFWLDLQLVGSCNISQILSPVRLGLGLGRAQMDNKMYSITSGGNAPYPWE